MLSHRFSTWPYVPVLGLLVVSSAILVWLQPNGTGAVVSEATVKSHVNHLLAKIGAGDRAQTVGYAYWHGLVP